MPILGKILLCAVLALPACFGSTPSNAQHHASEFALESCSLGCNGPTCSVNAIATNQSITLTFNDYIDLSTVSLTEISVIQIPSGVTPPIEFFVNKRNQITIRPTLFETESGLQFGFEEGSQYRIQLFANTTNVVRSVIGRPNTTLLNCTITTAGILDLVPGRPEVAFTPSSTSPPVSSVFDITMVFNDLMQKAQLVDSTTGLSPTISVQVIDDTQSPSVLVDVPGIFSISFDQDALTTTLVFSPLSPFPGGRNGKRRLRLNFSTQISDLFGNAITNPGSYEVALPEAASLAGTFDEGFTGASMLDDTASGVGMWASSPGAVDSGLDPVSGSHVGGGPGYLGTFAPLEDFQFDTDQMTMPTVAGSFATITDGVFVFDSIHIPVGVNITVIGSNPLRLFSRGELLSRASCRLKA